MLTGSLTINSGRLYWATLASRKDLRLSFMVITTSLLMQKATAHMQVYNLTALARLAPGNDACVFFGLSQSLFQIVQQIFYILYPDAQAQQIIYDTCFFALGFRDRTMGHTNRVIN